VLSGAHRPKIYEIVDEGLLDGFDGILSHYGQPLDRFIDSRETIALARHSHVLHDGHNIDNKPADAKYTSMSNAK
jgi:hypothetical protein